MSGHSTPPTPCSGCRLPVLTFLRPADGVMFANNMHCSHNAFYQEDRETPYMLHSHP